MRKADRASRKRLPAKIRAGGPAPLPLFGQRPDVRSLDERADRAFANLADAPSKNAQSDDDHEGDQQPDQELFSMRCHARQHSNLL